LLFSLYKELKYLKKQGLQIVHCHGTRPIYVGTIAAKLAGIRHVLITIHNSYKYMAYNQDFQINGILHLVSVIIHTIALILCNHAIFVSRNIFNELKKTYSFFPCLGRLMQRKTSVIYNWVDIDFFRPTKKSMEWPIIIGQVGRLDPNKCTKNLLLATKKLRKIGYNIKLLIAGDGYLKNELVRFSKRNGLEDVVHFAGHIEPACEIYQKMDMLVISSNSEGLPLVLLEAMLSGLPVVSTDVGAVNEIIRDKKSGVLVRPNDVESLIKGIRYFIDDRATMVRIAQKGQDVVLSKFSKSRLIDSVFKVYGENANRN